VIDPGHKKTYETLVDKQEHANGLTCAISAVQNARRLDRKCGWVRGTVEGYHESFQDLGILVAGMADEVCKASTLQEGKGNEDLIPAARAK
jgi:hypothetical protein